MQVCRHPLGNIPKGFPKLTSGTGKNDLDSASVQAIREAAPFAHLPDKFSQLWSAKIPCGQDLGSM